MSNNPSTMFRRTRRVITFCLATRDLPGETGADTMAYVCTRINDHNGHCCDEVRRVAWVGHGRAYVCTEGYIHDDEKGLERSIAELLDDAKDTAA